MIPPQGRRGRIGHGGLLANGTIAIGWLASLVLCLGSGAWPRWSLILGVVLRTQFQTGLFILGHDAMHGILWPGRSRANHILGSVALALYGALPYRLCRSNHHRHHRAPATASDPDAPPIAQSGAVRWYCTFMAGYLSGPQMVRLLASWGLLAAVFSAITPSAARNVLLFCSAPLLLSSLQLFTFGTYLPHRRQLRCGGGEHPESLALPRWLSLLACFHFGYHREHHEFPALAWYELPTAPTPSREVATTDGPS